MYIFQLKLFLLGKPRNLVISTSSTFHHNTQYYNQHTFCCWYKMSWNFSG